MKKTVSFMLALIIMISACSVSCFSALASTIVSSDGYRYESNNSLTKSEWIYDLVLTSGEINTSISGIANPFSDVNELNYYYNAVLIAYDKGIIEPDESGMFNGDESVTIEYAVHTLNSVLSFDLNNEKEENGKYPYSFESPESYTYTDDIQVAIEQKWVEESYQDNYYIQNILFDDNYNDYDAKGLLDVYKDYLSLINIDDSDTKWELTDDPEIKHFDISDFSYDPIDTYSNHELLRPKKDNIELNADDLFTVKNGKDYYAYKVVSAYDTDEQASEYHVCPVVDSADYAKIFVKSTTNHTVTSDQLEYIPTEYAEQLNTQISENNGLKQLNFTVPIDKSRIHFDVKFSGVTIKRVTDGEDYSTAISFKSIVAVNGELKDVSEHGKFEVCKMAFSDGLEGAEFEISPHIDVEGSGNISFVNVLEYELIIKNGEITKGKKPKVVTTADNSFTGDFKYNLNGELGVEISLSGKYSCLEFGVSNDCGYRLISDIRAYDDGEEPKICEEYVQYLYGEFSLELNNKEFFKYRYSDFDNSPYSKENHYETDSKGNRKAVDKCTRGVDYYEELNLGDNKESLYYSFLHKSKQLPTNQKLYIRYKEYSESSKDEFYYFDIENDGIVSLFAELPYHSNACNGCRYNIQFCELNHKKHEAVLIQNVNMLQANDKWTSSNMYLKKGRYYILLNHECASKFLDFSHDFHIPAKFTFLINYEQRGANDNSTEFEHNDDFENANIFDPNSYVKGNFLTTIQFDNEDNYYLMDRDVYSLNIDEPSKLSLDVLRNSDNRFQLSVYRKTDKGYTFIKKIESEEIENNKGNINLDDCYFESGTYYFVLDSHNADSMCGELYDYKTYRIYDKEPLLTNGLEHSIKNDYYIMTNTLTPIVDKSCEVESNNSITDANQLEIGTDVKGLLFNHASAKEFKAMESLFVGENWYYNDEYDEYDLDIDVFKLPEMDNGILNAKISKFKNYSTDYAHIAVIAENADGSFLQCGKAESAYNSDELNVIVNSSVQYYLVLWGGSEYYYGEDTDNIGYVLKTSHTPHADVESEFNGTMGTADTVCSVNSSTICSVVSYPTSDDYYEDTDVFKVTPNKATELKIKVSPYNVYNCSDCIKDVYLSCKVFDKNGNEIYSDYTQAGTTISVPVSAGTYYVYIYNYTNLECTDHYEFYTLSIRSDGEHALEVTSYTAPTCTEPGSRLYKCTQCSYTDTETIPALGHDYKGVVTNPTCTQQGYTTYTCTRCRDSYIAERVNPHGHKYIISSVNWNTLDTSTGKVEADFYCSYNASHTKTETVQSEYKAVQSQGENQAELTRYTVKSNDFEDSITVKTKEPLAHSHIPGEPKIENKVPATCSAEGSYDEVVYCTTCGKVLSSETKTINKLPHKEVIDKAIPATCTKSGKTEGSHCSVCGKIIIKQISIKATGHKIVKDKAVAPTFTRPGKTEGSHCSVCKEVLVKQKTLKKLGKPKLKRLVAGKITLTVYWKNVKNVGGYQINYCKNKSFQNSKVVTIKGEKPKKKKIKGVSPKRKYYVRIRAYKWINGKRYYSKWSAVKTVTTKR
ncbi:MAG: S-layer homology domain-containing protein [Eubacterium sp.]|nr:S-layer homology domain-containing protein [Eubacterium sp.]